MNEKLLSIYIPTYNRENHIKRQLEFLLSEVDKVGWADIEIVVSDNCSTDNTQHTVEQIISNTPIRYHKNEKNIGIVGNAYKASEMTVGKYIWVIGDDDFLEPSVLSYVIEILKKYPEIGLLHLNYSDIETKDQVVYEGKEVKTSEGFPFIKDLGYIGMASLVLTSANVWLKSCYDMGVRVLNIDEPESYGWSMFVSMACLKQGDTYITDKVFVHNNTANMSWGNIVYESRTGVMRVFVKLQNAGYSKREIKQIYKIWVNSRLIGIILEKLVEERQYNIFVKDFLFSFSRAPGNWIKRVLFLISHRNRESNR